MARIIVVDDDKDTRDILRILLQQNGHTVETASNGTEGLQKIRSGQYDLVLLDIMMPDKDGYTLIQEMEGGKPPVKIPIIIISAHPKLKGIFNISKDTEIQSFIGKPFNTEEVIEKVNGALEKKQEDSKA